jgi:hypothetical protein
MVLIDPMPTVVDGRCLARNFMVSVTSSWNVNPTRLAA